MANNLDEALLATGASALIAKQIDPVLVEYQRRYAPLVRAIPSTKWGSSVYYFNKRTQFPAGGFVTDGGARPVSTSTFVQENFQIKHLQSVGAVTGYAQAVTSTLIGDLRAKEIEGAAQGLYWDIETAILWGAATPTVQGPYPQFDGFDVIFSAFSSSPTGGPSLGVGGGGIDNYGGATTWGVPAFSPYVESIDQNVIDGSSSHLTYGIMDQAIDLLENNAAAKVQTTGDYMFVASPSAISRLAQLSLQNQRFVNTVEIEPGLMVDTYRGVPLVPSSFLSPRTNAVGTVVAAAGGTGTLNTTYHYRVSAIIARYGEIQASADATFAAVTQGIKLSFSVPTVNDGSGSQPTHYKVYRGTSSSNQTLLGYVDGQFLDSTGTQYQTSYITDTGATLVAGNTAATTVQATPPAAYVYTNANLKPLTSSGEQNIYLVSRDADNIVRPYVREMQPKDLYATTSSPDSLPFAFVADCTLAVRATKFGVRIANVICALDQTAGNGVIPTNASYTPIYVVE
jgi:hypothetical protein